MKDVGLFIKILRTYKDLTQSRLLEGKYATSYLSRVESGDTMPSEKFLDFIAGKLNVTKEDLSSNHSIAEQESEITRIYDNFRETSTLPDKDFLYLFLRENQSFSMKTYLKIYSTLIRYYIKELRFEEAESVVYKSKSWVSKIDDQLNNEPGDEFAYYLMDCGDFYYKRQDYFEADKYYAQVEQLNLNGENLGDLFLKMSLTKRQLLSDTNHSLEYANKANRVFADHQSIHRQYRALIVIAELNAAIGNYEEAMVLLNETRRYLTDQKDVEMLIRIMCNLGHIEKKERK